MRISRVGLSCALVALVCALFCASSATAKPEIVCDPYFPSHCSVELPAQIPAPWHGVLVTRELSISLGQKALHCDRLVQI